MIDPAALIDAAVGRFGLKVRESNGVPDSFSSIVRILAMQDGGRAVLKIPWSRGKWDREHAALTALAGLPGVPRLLDAFADGDDRLALLLEWLPGEPVGSADRCSPAIARGIGESLARMHQRQLPFTGTDAEAVGWWPWLMAFVRDAVGRCRAHAVPGDWDAIERRFEIAVAGLPAVTDLRVVQFDCRLGNFLADAERCTGHIDFESARNGSRDIDFAKLDRDFERHPALLAAMREGYSSILPLPELLAVTVPLYRLYEPVVAVAFSLKRGRGAGDPFFDANLAMIRTLTGRGQACGEACGDAIR